MSVFSSVLILDKRCRSKDRLNYDTDSFTMVCDNIANFHICNRHNMFVGEIRKSLKSTSFYHQRERTSAFRNWNHQMDMAWRLRKISRFTSWRCTIFPQYTINIMSLTCFARHLNDLTCTGTNTQKLHSYFYCDSNKFSLTIQHPPSNLPEISINEGFALSTTFRALVSRVMNVSNHPRYVCCFTNMYADDHNEDHCTDKLGEN